MNMLRCGEEFLRQWRNEHMSDELRYTSIVGDIALTPCGTQAATSVETGDDNIIIHAKTVDWLIDAAAIGNHEPQPGDTIEFLDPGRDSKYEVMALAGEKCWRWHGRNNTTYRIHTKLVSETV